MKQWPFRLGTPMACLLLAGCRDVQSVLAPQGPSAAQIANLAWLLFGVGALASAIVIVALWLAMRGSPRMRSRLAAEGAVIAGGIVFPAVTLTGLLAYDAWLMRAGGHARDENDMARIEIVGEQWWWRVGYADVDGGVLASANEIRIPVGREIEFTLKSADVIHSFWVPSLGGKVDMIPGRATRLRVRADRPGIFRGQCAEYCGGPHALMALEVIAMPAADFTSWLLREAAPAEQPATDAERRGKAILLAAGCGACHAVRGTGANGSIGPDLTHVGARRSVGVDTLPMTPANLKRFIVDGQHIKPGNAMPQFRFVSPDDLDALAAYLMSLR
jgi:cytochrome c oxidase subunit II